MKTQFFNVHDFFAIGIMALLFVYVMNFTLKSIGLGKFSTTNGTAGSE